MRRLLVTCVVAVAVVVAFAVARRGRAVMAAGSGGLTIAPATPLTAPLAGCPLGPAFTFCDEPVGGTSQTQRFTLTATTAANNLVIAILQVPGLPAQYNPGDFTVASTDCPTVLTAGSSCSIDVAFTPTAASLREAALTASDPSAGTASINIEGTGSNLALTPPDPPSGCTQDDTFHRQDNAFTYCNEPVGGVSGTQTFTLTAGSTATGLNITLAAIPGLSAEFAAGDFTIESTDCTGTLLAGQSCTTDIAFTPTTAGLRAAGLTATDAGGDSTTIYLAGHTTTGLELVPSSSACHPLGGLFEFCNEPVGGQTATTAFTLTNTSGAQVTGISVPSGSAARDFKVVSTTCVATLAASASCTINVAFTPQNTGLRQDALTVTAAEGDLGMANFAGIGDDYTLALPSDQSLELSVVAGGTATFNAKVVPDGVFGQDREKVTFACPTNLPINTSCAITPCPASVTAGTPASFQITFVTSSAANVAPMPTGGCSGYGPSVQAWSPGGQGPVLDSPRAPGIPARVPRFPALSFADFALLAIIAAMALVLGKAYALAGQARRRAPLIFAAGILIAAALTGCRHKGTTGPTSATPAGATTMTILGNAVDSNGRSLNASRPLQIILDVTAK